MLRELFIKDFGWKFFSLLLAAFIWLTVHKIIAEPNGTVTISDLPVFLVASAADVHLYRVAPGTVSVTVGGSPDALATLSASQIRATVNFTETDTTKDSRRQVDISVPYGITLLKVDPAQVGVLIPPASIKQP